MKTWHRFTIAAVACAAGLTLACSGKTDGGNGGDGGGSSGGGSGGSSSGGSSSACDDYFNTIFSGACESIGPLPASEVTRIQGRFDTLCAAALTLPGVSLNATSLEACVAAVKSGGCSVLDQEQGPCTFDTGSLAAGATCVTAAQCQGGDCTASNEEADGGQMLCGTCVTPPGLGQSCAGTLQCGPGAECSGDGTGPQTCTAIAYGGVGASCSTPATQCNPGLYCNYASGTVCAAPGAAGTPCTEDQGCASPLICPSASGSSTCQSPGAAGAPCEDDMDCVSGLGCGQSSHQCLTVTFVGSGQPCSDSIRCLVGGCNVAGTATTGMCPTVIPDGQACSGDTATSTCDTFANCEGGTCVLGYASCP